MGNVDVEPVTVYDDDQRRVVRVTVLDLETNVAYHTPVTIEKTIVRRFLKKGEEALRVMVNSKGETTYLLPATDDDVYSKQQNLASKALRNNILRLLPGDIQAECRDRILAIRKGEAAKDPDGFRRKVADGFASLNVLPSHLKEYLGHDLAQSSPAELTDLRDLWKAIEDGKTTWAEALAAELETRGEQPAEAGAEKAEQKKGLEGVTERLKAQKSEAPACAGCGKPEPTCDAQDDEGKAFHRSCLDVQKKEREEMARAAQQSRASKPARQGRLSE
jgi:hypothetical protein